MQSPNEQVFIPKAEKNPVHKTSLPKIHRDPVVIAHPPSIQDEDYHRVSPAIIHAELPQVQPPILPQITPLLQSEQKINKPIGSFRGGLIGFLLGISLTGTL